MVPPGDGRTVTLVLVDGDGELAGQLPPFDVDTPWWQDLEPILAAHPGVVVLRLLSVVPQPGCSMGGDVRYLAEVDWPPPGTVAFDGDRSGLADHPLRMPWARPGGPAADLAWALDHVDASGRPQQVRSWNLSSIWRIPTGGGDVWLKCVPPFFAHEAAVLRAFGDAPTTPTLLADDGHRMLLAAMPGRDGYDADPAQRRRSVDELVALQLGLQSTPARLEAIVPDWRGAALRSRAAEVIRRRAAERPGLEALLAGWDDRLDAVDGCGLPDTLFHGDFHGGNTRVDADRPVIFDWGDSGLGHPLLDLAGPDGDGDPALVAHWLRAWAAAAPGSDPDRAWALLRPVAALRGAIVFQRFLDNIEPSERVYHQHDVEPFLDRAARLLEEPEAG